VLDVANRLQTRRQFRRRRVIQDVQKFDETGKLIDPGFQKNIDVFVGEFLWLAESLAPEMQSII